MKPVKYTREFKRGDRGPDVEAVGRALARAKVGGMRILIYDLRPKRVKRLWGKRKMRALRAFKRKNKLVADFKYTLRAHKALTPFFDHKARVLMNSYKDHSKHENKFNKLINSMRDVSRNTAGYLYGGGHGTPIKYQDSHDRFDCSSAVSKVLYDAGVFPSEYAWTSGQLTKYGEPGKGKYFTVYANSGHAFIRLHKTHWWRFDTSPYGIGRRGGRLRHTPRPTFGFTARHWKGM